MMKFSLLLALPAAFFLASCAEEPPPPITQHHRPATYASTQPQEYPPQQQPFNPNGPVQPMATPPPQVATTVFTSPYSCTSDKGGQGRLSLRNPRPWQTAPGGEPVFARQIYRCGRIPSRHRGEGPLHRQNLSCAVTPSRHGIPPMRDTECQVCAPRLFLCGYPA